VRGAHSLLFAGSLALGAALSVSREARALELVRLSRNGYVLVDEADAVTPYDGRVPTRSTVDTLAFVAEVTQLIANIPDAPRARFIAVMQSGRDFGNALAFYMPIKNTVRGIGQRQGGRETWDLNDTAGTAFPLLGFVWLNSWWLYIGPAGQFGNSQVCTQEFGHRWGPQVIVPPYPTGASVGRADAAVDASAQDASDGDASAQDGGDASAPDAAVMGAAIAPMELLGRDRAHWSYFYNSGGSPLEGNNWTETTPGVFRAGAPTYRFSPLDLYMMGVMAPEEVPPSFVIAEPQLMNVRDELGNPITAASAPESGARELELRGRRVNVGIEDIIRANGPRNPAAVSIAPTLDTDGGLLPDAAAPPRAGEPRENDIDVIWVMLTTRDRLRDIDVFDFDRAVDSCSGAYAYASQGRSVIVPMRMPTPAQDGGVEAGVAVSDASADGSSDGAVGAESGPFALGGGCACRAAASAPPHAGFNARWAIVAWVAMAWAGVRRRRPRA
jgi:hypothetical protein